MLAPEAIEDLRELRANVRVAVRDAIECHLRHEPSRTSRTRIERLRALSRPQYRLRVEDIRVFYDVAEGTVEVLGIVPKHQAAQWLARMGEPDEDRTAE